jgi:glycosyltransferase involved in cell wall biosynthesis
MVPIDDSAALADGIKNLLANAALCASLGTAGRARFEAEFSVATVTAAWLTFCNKVAG